MRDITVNTTTLNNLTVDLNQLKKYYLSKKTTFQNINSGGSGKVSSFCRKIANIYNSIGSNINEITEYLEDYYQDVEALENKFSENNGYIKSPGVNGFAQKYIKIIKDFEFPDEELFKIISMKEPTIPLSQLKNVQESQIAEAKNAQSALSFTSSDGKTHSLTDAVSAISIDEASLKELVLSQGLEVDDPDYQVVLTEMIRHYEEQRQLYEAYMDEIEAEINKYNDIEMMKSASKLKDNLNIAAIGQKNINYETIILQMIEKNFGSIEEYESYMADLYSQLSLCQEAIKQIDQTSAAAKYQSLTVVEDYQEYVYNPQKVDLEKIERFTSEDGKFIGVTSYEEYCQKYGEVNEIEYLKALKQKLNSQEFSLNLDHHTKMLLNLIEASEIDPNYEKTYHYIYEKNGIEAANQYLKEIEANVNNDLGYKKAQEFLKSLSTSDNVQSATLNHLKTSGKGFFDGAESFFDGLDYAMSAITNIISGEETRANSVNEYETMHILEALSKGEFTGGKYLTNNYEISQGIGNMVPSIILSSVNPFIGSAALGISAGGNSYHSALVDGYSNEQALAYGVISGCSEMTTERMLGGIPGLSNTQVVDFKSFLKSMAKEGFEEGFQESLDAVVRAGVFAEDTDPEELKKNIMKSAIYGAITAGFLQSPNAILNKINVRKINNRLNSGDINTEEIINKLKSEGIETDGKQVQELIAEQADKIVKDFKLEAEPTSQNEQVQIPKPTNSIKQTKVSIEEQIAKANHYSQKGNLLSYTIELDGINSINAELLSQIYNPSVVKFKVGDEILTYLDMKERLGLINIKAAPKTIESQIAEINYHTQKGDLLSSTIELDSINSMNAELLSQIYDPSVVKFKVGDEILTYLDMKERIGLINIKAAPKTIEDQIAEINYHTQKGDLLSSTIELDSIDSMNAELLSQIYDPSVVKFKVGDEILTYLDMKERLGLVSKADNNVNRTIQEKIDLANHYASKNNFITIDAELSEITLDNLQSLTHPELFNIRTKDGTIYNYEQVLKAVVNQKVIFDKSGNGEINETIIQDLEKLINSEIDNRQSKTLEQTEKIVDKVEELIVEEPTEKRIDKDATEELIFEEPTEKRIDINKTEDDLGKIPEVEKIQNENIKNIKEEILNELNPEWDELSTIRKLYIELNRRLHYDVNYSRGTNEKKNQIYLKEISFNNLMNKNIICKSWSELFKELLVAGGIDENRVKIVGFDKIGGHRWIEINMPNGVIIADATENIHGMFDLSNCKTNSATFGLLYGTDDFRGARLRNIPKEIIMQASKKWINIDQSIEYVKGKDYTNETVGKADKLFNKSKIYKKLFGEQQLEKIFETKIPEGMDGLEAKYYFENLNKILLENTNGLNSSIRLETGWATRPTQNGLEWVTTLRFNNGTQSRFMIYSESLGRIEFTNFKDFVEFHKKNKLSR